MYNFFMTYRDYLDFYSVLNIEPGASKEDIKVAYLQMAKQYHPDRFTTPKEKKEAELKFKKIAEAYQELKSVNENYDEFMEENSFSSFFEEDYSKINDFGDNSAAFLKFYFAQEELNSQQENKKNPQEKNKKHSSHNFKNEAIKIFEKYIKDNKLNLIYIYECIKTNKPIVSPSDKIDDFESYSSLLVKEVIYRRYIKTTKEYELYILKHKYFKNIDLSGTLYVDVTYPKKKFEEHITYISKKICLHCNGVGCDQCKNGYMEFEHTVNIKVPYISRQPMFFEIKDGGNQSPFGNGKLFLEVIFTNNKINEMGYKFDLKNKYQITFDPIIQAANLVWIQLKVLYELILNNKHTSGLYFLISILIIIIICLAVLL